MCSLVSAKAGWYPGWVASAKAIFGPTTIRKDNLYSEIRLTYFWIVGAEPSENPCKHTEKVPMAINQAQGLLDVRQQPQLSHY